MVVLDEPLTAGEEQLSVIWPVAPSSFLFGYNATTALHASPHATLKTMRDTGGCRAVRFSIGWLATENYSTGEPTLTTLGREILEACRDLDIIPFITLSYGPPYEQVAAPKLTAEAKEGDYVLHVDSAPSMEDWKLYVNNTAATGLAPLTHASDPGTLIASTTANTITLAYPLEKPKGSSATIKLANETVLHVNRRKYDPVKSEAPGEEGAIAYMRYARFVMEEALRICPVVYGCLWNEFLWDAFGSAVFLWAAQPWHSTETFHAKELVSHEGHVYEAIATAKGLAQAPPNATFWVEKTGIPAAPDSWSNNEVLKAMLARAMIEAPLPDGGYYIDGGSDTTAKGLLQVFTAGERSPGATAQIHNGCHNYGFNPEITAVTPGTWLPINPTYDKEQAVKKMVKVDREELAHGYHVKEFATECGTIKPSTSEARQANYNLRRVLSNWGVGFGASLLFSWEELEGRESIAAQARLQRLVDSLGGDGDPATVPVLSPPSAAWEWCQVTVPGVARSVSIIWQRTALTVAGESGWDEIPPATPVNVPYALGKGHGALVEVINLRTGAQVSTAGGVIPVSDDPIAVVSAPGFPPTVP